MQNPRNRRDISSTTFDQVFPSEYLKPEDLTAHNINKVSVVIKSITMDMMNNKFNQNKKIEKPVLWFEKAKKGLILNK